MAHRRSPAPVATRRVPPGKKTYSIVPVDATINTPFQPRQRASELMLLRAYAESPWLHIKYARLAASFASIPFSAVIENDIPNAEPQILPKNYPLNRLFRHPNPYLRGWDFRFLTELYTRVVGSCWWRVIKNGFGVPEQLWVYPNHWVKPVLYSPTEEVTVELRTPMTAWHVERIPLREMVWLRTPDPTEPYARGLGDAVSLETETDTFGLASESDRRFFQNDASPPGALVVPGRMEQEEVNRMRDDWHSKYGGAPNYGTIPVLFGGMDYKTFRTGRKEMDFIQGQAYLRDVIIAGVHKHVLGITEDVNFAAAKAADYQVSKWEIAPRVPWWEDYADHIAAMYDPRVVMRWDNPVPQDEQLELDRANEGWLRGAITRNEWRRANGFRDAGKQDGDVYILQSGVTVVPTTDPQTRVDTEEDLDDFMDPMRLAMRRRAASKEPTLGKDEANYRRAPSPERRCELCMMFREPNACSLVKGRIDPNFTCDHFSLRKGVKARPRPMHPAWERAAELVLAGVDDKAALAALKPVYEAIMSMRLDAVNDELGATMSMDIRDPIMEQYIHDHAAAHVRHVDDVTRQRIRSAIEEGVRAKEDVSRIAERVNAVFGDAKEARSMVIARTESLDASNWSARAAYLKSPVVEMVEWLLDPDYDAEKDDGYCQELADLSPVPKDQPFGDVWAAPAHPQCVCSVAPVVGDEEKGYSPRWAGDERKAHAVALKAEHLRAERAFLNRLKRVFQEQQRDCARALRESQLAAV